MPIRSTLPGLIHRSRLLRAAALLCCAPLAGCAPPAALPDAPQYVQRRIELRGPASRSEAEISGMAWRQGELWLMPQCPGALSRAVACAAYVVPEAAVRGYLASPAPAPLEPEEVPVDWSALQGRVSGSQGFEAVAFAGDRVFVTVEASAGARMLAYLASGRVAGDPRRLVLDAVVPVPLPEEARCDPRGSWACNKSMEALLVAGSRVLVFFEVNGERHVAAPAAPAFDLELRPLGALPVEPLEFRLTDATGVDARGRFWVSNYHFPSDNLCAAAEMTAAACAEVVERLVEMEVTGSAVRRTGAPPLQIAGARPEGRNWEGIVRLGGEGLLVVTDAFPRPSTILCFVPFPGGGETPEDRCR